MRARVGLRHLAVVAAVTIVAAACGGGGQTVRVPAGEAASRAERVAGAESDAQIGARVVNDLGLALLRLSSGAARGNSALAPWSIATALAMTRVGARVATASEMDEVLHVADRATFDQAMNALDQALRARNRTMPMGSDEPLVIDLAAANRLFAQVDLNLDAGFLDTLAARYGAAVGKVDYKAATEAARRAINSWVAAETRDRIPELIPDGVLDVMTRLVLVNAVYLRADWAIPFARQATSDATFHATSGDVIVPFMRGTETWGWSEGDGWKAVELPYIDGELAMTLVVPDVGKFDQVASAFDHAMLDRIAAAKPARVRLSLPKFDIASAAMLREQLIALGMPTAFSDSADFSGITPDEPLQIAEVVHQANVTVDEKGTVAAAATAVVARATSATVGEPKQLDIDRPFLFLVRDRPTDALLFAGQVTDPA